MPYSLDLRLRVLSALDGGMSKWTAHKTFRVSRSTIDHWLNRREATGNVAAKSGFRCGVLPLINDLKQFEEFAVGHSDLTLMQMAQAWHDATGCRVSNVTIGKALKRIGWTRKKRVVSTLNAAKKNDGRFSRC